MQTFEQSKMSARVWLLSQAQDSAQQQALLSADAEREAATRRALQEQQQREAAAAAARRAEDHRRQQEAAQKARLNCRSPQDELALSSLSPVPPAVSV